MKLRQQFDCNDVLLPLKRLVINEAMNSVRSLVKYFIIKICGPFCGATFIIKTPGSHYGVFCIIIRLRHERQQQWWWRWPGERGRNRVMEILLSPGLGLLSLVLVVLKCSRWRLAGCGVRWCQVNHGKFHLEIRIMSQSEWVWQNSQERELHHLHDKFISSTYIW